VKPIKTGYRIESRGKISHTVKPIKTGYRIESRGKMSHTVNLSKLEHLMTRKNVQFRGGFALRWLKSHLLQVYYGAWAKIETVIENYVC